MLLLSKMFTIILFLTVKISIAHRVTNILTTKIQAPTKTDILLHVRT